MSSRVSNFRTYFFVGIVNQNDNSSAGTTYCPAIKEAEELAVDLSQDTNKVVGIWKYVEPEDLSTLHKLVFGTHIYHDR